MRLGTRTVALVTILALHSVTSVPATPNLTGYPNSMAATGDSITRAYNTGTVPFSDGPDNSWSTGTRTSVGSHYGRILTAEPAILGRNYNQAVTGAKMAGLWAQMQQVNDRGVAYVTVLMGANDLCTRTVAGMTLVADFRAQFERAMAALSAGSPGARIYVVSIPDVYRLWVILKDDLLARFVWRTLDVCQSLLERPRFTDGSDVMRRMTVRQRNIEFNVQLAECARCTSTAASIRAPSSPTRSSLECFEARLLPSLTPRAAAACPGHVERELPLLGPDTSSYYGKHGCR